MFHSICIKIRSIYKVRPGFSRFDTVNDHPRARGFTLIELLVAAALFVTISILAIGSLLNYITTADQMSTGQSVTAELNRFLSRMSRELQNGTGWYVCDAGSGVSCSVSSDSIFFSNAAGEMTRYELSGTSIRRISEDGDNTRTSDNIRITTLEFDRSGNRPPDRVNITIRGEAGTTDQNTEKFNLYTSVSERLIDPGERSKDDPYDEQDTIEWCPFESKPGRYIVNFPEKISDETKVTSPYVACWPYYLYSKMYWPGTPPETGCDWRTLYNLMNDGSDFEDIITIGSGSIPSGTYDVRLVTFDDNFDSQPNETVRLRLYRGKSLRDITYGIPWSLGEATYVNDKIDVGKETAGVLVSGDGSKVFVGDTERDRVWVYDLYDNYELYSADIDSRRMALNPGSSFEDIDFNGDGTIFYVLWSGGAATQFHLDTPYDLSSVVGTSGYDFSSVTSAPRGFAVSPDGDHMYVTDGLTLYHFDMSSYTFWGDIPPEDPAYTGESYEFASVMPDIDITPSGGWFYAIDRAAGDIREHEMLTNWSLADVGYYNTIMNPEFQGWGHTTLNFTDDGYRIYIAKGESNLVYEHILADVEEDLIPPPDTASTTEELEQILNSDLAKTEKTPDLPDCSTPSCDGYEGILISENSGALDSRVLVPTYVGRVTTNSDTNFLMVEHGDIDTGNDPFILNSISALCAAFDRVGETPTLSPVRTSDNQRDFSN